MNNRFRLTALLLALLAAPAIAQEDPDLPDEPTTGGVYIDADGMVRHNARDLIAAAKAAKLRSLRKDADPSLVYISVPKLLETARKHQAAGEPIPLTVRTLHGMTKLRYIFVLPDDSDLIIAGPAELLDVSNPHRPIGAQTGRPALHLDDLVTALRIAGPAARGRGFGCSIDMPDGAQAAVNRIMSGPRTDREQRLRDLSDAVGPQKVRIINLADDTRLASVCVEADYALKRLAIGLDRTPVPSVRYPLGRGGAQFTRWWFAAAESPALAADASGTTFEIVAPTLSLVTSPEANTRGSNPVAEQYAERFTAKMDEFAAAVPEIADLWNLTDLALLAALIKAERIDRKIGWDTAVVNELRVAKVTVPRTAVTLVNHASSTYAVGGVYIEPSTLTRRVEPGDEDPQSQSQPRSTPQVKPLPEGGWFRIDNSEER